MVNHKYPLTDSGYIKLWSEYQYKALQKLKQTKKDVHPQGILWTSTLTNPENIGKYIRPEDYIIQVWTLKTDQTIKSLLNNKFKIILSNYDELYFDCG